MLLARGSNGLVGLGQTGYCDGFTWVPPGPCKQWNGTMGQCAGHWERMRAGQTQMPGPAGGPCPVVRPPSTPGGGTSTSDGSTPSSGSGTTWAEVKARLQQYGTQISERKRLFVSGYAAELAMQGAVCPESSRKAGYCYTGIITEPAMLVPGGFVSPGEIGWHVGELKAGGFEKTFTPGADQRFLIDYLIAKRSIDVIVPLAAMLAWQHPQKQSPSVNTVMARAGARTTITGFSLNPIVPTPDELTNPGGFDRWIARGGFPLSLEIAEGRAPAWNPDESIGIQACGSTLCACDTMPSCIRFNLDKDGLTYGVSSLSGGWVPYFAINGSGQTYTAALRYKDPSLLERAGGKIADALKALAGAFCAVSPTIKHQMSTAVAEKCTANGKPCTKGVAGCVCVSPPTSQQMAVGAGNAWMQHWCGRWAEETMPPAMPEPPMPPPGAQFNRIPLWAVAIAGVATGAFLFSRR